MSESARHMHLVSFIVGWVAKTYPADDLCVLVDEPNNTAANKPPNIGGYFPDVFVKAVGRPLTIIGEAKTTQDLETWRSKLQLISYLTFLKTVSDPCLVISTSWTVQRTAKGLMCHLRQTCDAVHVPLVFVTEMPPITC
jgi:hypothetical protein